MSSQGNTVPGKCYPIEKPPVCKGGKVWMGIVSPKYDFSFKQLMQNEEVRKYFIRSEERRVGKEC